MIDCHIHMVLDGMQWRSAIARHETGPDEKFIRATLARWQEKGYRWLRDGGDRWGAGKRARELAPEYGITYRTPFAPLSKKGHYGGFIGLQFSDLREYAALVQKQKEEGADFTKIMISGLMDFDHYGVLTQPGLEPAEIREMIAIAHDMGMSVMAHANGARTVEAAAAAGVDSVEHGAYLDRDAMATMIDGKAVWTPTLSTIGNLRGKGRFSQYDVEKILDGAMENVAWFYEAGGMVAAGTDAGAWAVPHGCCTEEDLLFQCGADPAAGNQEIQSRF